MQKALCCRRCRCSPEPYDWSLRSSPCELCDPARRPFNWSMRRVCSLFRRLGVSAYRRSAFDVTSRSAFPRGDSTVVCAAAAAGAAGAAAAPLVPEFVGMFAMAIVTSSLATDTLLFAIVVARTTFSSVLRHCSHLIAPNTREQTAPDECARRDEHVSINTGLLACHRRAGKKGRFHSLVQIGSRRSTHACPVHRHTVHRCTPVSVTQTHVVVVAVSCVLMITCQVTAEECPDAGCCRRCCRSAPSQSLGGDPYPTQRTPLCPP